MVDWLAGKRVRGTSSERTPLGTDLGGTGVGGWVEVGRTTLGSAGDTITVSSLADKRYYMILEHTISSGYQYPRSVFNNDNGTNYTNRYSTNGGADGSTTSATAMVKYPQQDTSSSFTVSYVANLSSKEKLLLGNGVGANGTSAATAAPNRREFTDKWANESDAINRYDALNGGSGDFASGSETVILGWDPDDTHTNNFWEELASDEASGSVASLESGTISAKKYLWIQCYISGTSTSTFCETLFNNDTGANYAGRASQSGGSDFTRISQTDLNMFESYSNTTGAFLNAFIINNASNEKLGIAHSVREGTSGAGNAPERDEVVFKWANTSSQITDISFTPQSGTINSGSILKVWGAD